MIIITIEVTDASLRYAHTCDLAQAVEILAAALECATRDVTADAAAPTG
jgi:hypothetical protein